jgi:hypothetical protein
VFDGLRMLDPRPHLTVTLFFLRPIFKQFPAQQTDLLNGVGFRLIGAATFGNRLIHQVGDAMQAGQHLGAARQALFQRVSFGVCGRCRVKAFIVHEPFQIYKTRPRSQVYFQ